MFGRTCALTVFRTTRFMTAATQASDALHAPRHPCPEKIRAPADGAVAPRSSADCTRTSNEIQTRSMSSTGRRDEHDLHQRGGPEATLIGTIAPGCPSNLPVRRRGKTVVPGLS